ncbi:MAG: DUF2007 domain-containing protein [Candidatus Thiodiazotropha sp.]|jgi:hypothetical protein
MRKLYQAVDRVEAQMLKDYLQEQNITCALFGDLLSGATGELPANIFPELWVMKDEQYQRARWLIDEFKAAANDPAGESWRCPVCGEVVDPGFDLCWNCATPRIKQE